MTFDPVVTVESEIRWIAHSRPFGLHWGHLLSDIDPPSHTPVFRGRHLLHHRDLFAHGDYRGLGRAREILAGATLDRPIAAPRNLSTQLNILLDERIRLSELLTGARSRFPGLRRGVLWEGVEEAIGGITRFFDTRVSLTRLDLLHAAMTGQPIGSIYFHEGIRTLLDLPGAGPADLVSVQRYLAGRSAVGSQLMRLVGSSDERFRRGIAWLRSPQILHDTEAEDLLRKLTGEIEEDAKGLGRFLWARKKESGEESFRRANEVVCAERSKATGARGALTRGYRLLPAFKTVPAEVTAAIEPALTLGARASCETYAARVAMAHSPIQRAGVVHSLFRQHLKTAGLLGLGALVLFRLSGNSFSA